MLRRRPLIAVALAGALLGGSACSDGGDASPPSTTSVPPELTTTVAPTVGEPLQVVEQGLVSFPDPYVVGQTLGGYGVVLHNPNPGLLASGVHVTTRILDDQGTQLLVDTSLLNGVMPGQRMAVGRTLVEPIVGPTQLDVQVEVGGWLTPARGVDDLKITQATTESELNGGAVTHFAIRSNAAATEDGVDVAALYRAADGRLLAVENASIDSLAPGGTVVGQIRLLAPIPGLATTEVLVGRGFAAQTVG